MLKSHMKSHSSSYDFQCGDCKYVTKYLHSLNQHLRKYQHTRLEGNRETKQQADILDLRIKKFTDP